MTEYIHVHNENGTTGIIAIEAFDPATHILYGPDDVAAVEAYQAAQAKPADEKPADEKPADEKPARGRKAAE